MTRSIFFVITLILSISTFIQAQGQGNSPLVPDTVIAESGEGIYAILRRNERNPALALPDFIALNKERLGNDSSLIKGKIYLIPPKALVDSLKAAVAVEEPPAYAESHPPEITPIEESLFGPKYSKVTLRDNRLEGSVYYLVTGHSGPDPGAIGNYGPYKLSEDEYAYDVTLRLARRLMEHGATVYMIVQDPNDGIRDDPILPMDKDEVHYPNQRIPASQVQRLKDRVKAINKLYVKHKENISECWHFISIAVVSDKTSTSFSIITQTVFPGKKLASLYSRDLSEQIQKTSTQSSLHRQHQFAQ